MKSIQTYQYFAARLRWSRLILVTAVVLGTPIIGTAAESSAATAKHVFKSRLTPLTGATEEKGVVWQRSTRVDLQAIREAGAYGGIDRSRLLFEGDPEDGQRTLRIEGVQLASDQQWVAKGVVEGLFGSRALFLVRGGRFAGTVRIPGDGVYVMQGPVDGECVVRKLDPLKLPRCGVSDLEFQKKAIEKLKAQKTSAATDAVLVDPSMKEVARIDASDQPALEDIHPLADPPVAIDMMVVYTAASRAGAGGREAMETLIELAVLEANDCFANSQINVQLNLVHTREMVYDETGDMQVDLNNLAFGLAGLNEVNNLRSLQFKADLVCLITEREDTGNIAGIAYVLQTPGGNSTYPSFSVVRRAYAVGDYTFAHEVGHNLGCAHDRANSNVQGAFPYAYGHRFNALGITYATVMTYPPGVRIPFFSNPNVPYNGVPSGLPDGNPNSADNAAAISQTGPVVSTYRAASRRYSFTQSRFEIGEGVAQATITVRRVGTSSTSTMSVKYATSNGDALVGQDYTAASGTLTFAAGQTEASFAVPITNDATPESPESFLVTLSDPQPIGASGLGLDYQAQVVIRDNENSFHFEFADAVRSEAEGGISFKVIREGPVNGAASVTVRPTPGTALPGTDFVAADQVISFANGENEKTATVAVINDFLAEADKTITLGFINPAVGYAVTQPSQVNILLLDDDRPGAHDIAFNTGSGPNDSVFASVVRPNGNVIVGGGFSQFNGLIRAGVAELNAAGSINPGFDPGIGVSGTVFAMALRPDGRVVLGGAFTAINGTSRPNLAQLNVDGSLDSSFDPGLGPDATVRTLALTSDGKIVIGGFFTSYAGQSRVYLACVNAGGGLDSTFAPVASPNLPVRALMLQTDGKLIIGGDFTQVGAVARPYIARLTTTGGLDSTFTAFLDERVRALAMMPDGDALVGGEFTSANGWGYTYFARLNANGTTDTAFNLAARPDGFVRAIAVQDDQNILIGGDFTSVAGQSFGRVARVTSSGDLDASFQPGAGADAIVYSLAIDPGKYAVVGGEFDEFAGLPRSRVARVRTAPNVETFNPVIVPLVRGDVSGGPITIHFEGRSGYRYALEGSDNLTAWSGIVTNLAVANATQLTDQAPPATRRNYRIRQVP